MTREEIITQLIEYQKENELTQQQLADQLSLPLGTVQNWCSRRRLPNYDNMEKIKQLLEEGDDNE